MQTGEHPVVRRRSGGAPAGPILVREAMARNVLCVSEDQSLSDVATLLPQRQREAHKWQTAVGVAAGSPGMTGAPWLVARGALRAGAGYVRLGIPGGGMADLPPSEVVGLSLPRLGWGPALLPELDRVKALVMGPGLGRSAEVTASVRTVLGEAPVPIVLDADGLNAAGSADEEEAQDDGWPDRHDAHVEGW